MPQGSWRYVTNLGDEPKYDGCFIETVVALYNNDVLNDVPFCGFLPTFETALQSNDRSQMNARRDRCDITTCMLE